MNDGTSWVYVNGELYHSGVKGMKWGKHLPGTDWWKQANTRPGGSPFVRSINVKGSFKPQSTPDYSTQQDKYPTDRIESINKRKRISSKTDQAADKIAKSRDPYVYNSGNKRDNMQKRKKNPSFVERATNKAKAYGASIKVAAKSLVKNISNRASYGAYKAKKYISKIGSKAISAITNTANKYKDKVDGLLKRLGIKSQSKQEYRDSVSRRRPQSKADDAARKEITLTTQSGKYPLSRSGSSFRVFPEARTWK